MTIDANGNPILSAQGEGPTGSDQQATGGVPGSGDAQALSGAEARINELTARMRETERANAELQRQMMEQSQQAAARMEQLLAAQMQQGAGQQGRAVGPDFSNVDPELKAILDYQQAQFKQQMEIQNRQWQQNFTAVQAQLAGQQVQGLAQQYGDDPAVVAEAQKLLMQFPNLGTDNALDVARGRFAKQAAVAARQGQQQLQQFNGQGSGMTGHRAPQPVQQAQVPGRFVPPRGFDQLSLEKQVEIMESQMGDVPF